MNDATLLQNISIQIYGYKHKIMCEIPPSWKNLRSFVNCTNQNNLFQWPLMAS